MQDCWIRNIAWSGQRFFSQYCIGSLWGQTCCSVIDGKLQLKHESAAKKRTWTTIKNIKNVTSCSNNPTLHIFNSGIIWKQRCLVYMVPSLRCCLGNTMHDRESSIAAWAVENLVSMMYVYVKWNSRITVTLSNPLTRWGPYSPRAEPAPCTQLVPPWPPAGDQWGRVGCDWEKLPSRQQHVQTKNVWSLAKRGQ